jgi:hypothetical protein
MTFESGAPDVLVESAPWAIVEIAKIAQTTAHTCIERLIYTSNLVS